MFRRLGAASIALLAVFHVWLFADQIWDGELADPARLFRWAFAVGLVAALLWLRRRGMSLWRSRPAIAVWLVAAMLHMPAIGGVAAAEAAIPEVVSTLAPIAAGLAVVAAVLIFVFFRRRQSAAPFDRGTLVDDVARRPTLALLLVLSAPRPPPHSV